MGWTMHVEFGVTNPELCATLADPRRETTSPARLDGMRTLCTGWPWRACYVPPNDKRSSSSAHSAPASSSPLPRTPRRSVPTTTSRQAAQPCATRSCSPPPTGRPGPTQRRCSRPRCRPATDRAQRERTCNAGRVARPGDRELIRHRTTTTGSRASGGGRQHWPADRDGRRIRNRRRTVATADPIRPGETVVSHCAEDSLDAVPRVS